MGQTNNHKSNVYFLILGCKSFAVNYSLKSGTHHQTLGFIPGDALPGLHCNCLNFLLVLGAFSLQFGLFRFFSQMMACVTDSDSSLDLILRVDSNRFQMQIAHLNLKSTIDLLSAPCK